MDLQNLHDSNAKRLNYKLTEHLKSCITYLQSHQGKTNKLYYSIGPWVPMDLIGLPVWPLNKVS